MVVVLTHPVAVAVAAAVVVAEVLLTLTPKINGCMVHRLHGCLAGSMNTRRRHFHLMSNQILLTSCLELNLFFSEIHGLGLRDAQLFAQHSYFFFQLLD